ncbi:MAG: T9SS type A sorting domain-containing protein, partial [Chitinophagales bacterium]
FNDGDEFVFRIAREADCMAIVYTQSGGTFEDLVVVDFEGGSESELGAPYGVLFASLAIFPPAEASGEVGGFAEREVSIVNGGLACTHSIRYELDFSDTRATLDEILLNGVSLPFEVVNDGITVEIFDDFFFLIGNADACFDGDETLILTERFLLGDCQSAVGDVDFTHRVYWGCKEGECNPSEETESTIDLLPSSFIDLSFQNLTTIRPSSCTNGMYEVRIVNTGNQIATNLNVFLGWGAPIAQFSGGIVVNAQVNEISYPIVTDEGYSLDFRENTLSTIGLKDVNNDGFYDAFLPQDTLIVKVELDYDCDLLTTKSFKRYFYVEPYFTDACGKDRWKNHFTSFSIERFLTDQYIKGDTDIWNDGKDYTFSFCTEGTQKMNCSDNKAELELDIPSDLIPIRAYLNDGTLLNIEVDSDGKTVVKGIKGVSETCIQVDFQLECTCLATPKLLEIDWAYVYICEEGCGCRETFFEGIYEVYTHCKYNSVEECEGEVVIWDGDGCLATVGMKAERASLGWTDLTFTEHVEATDENIQLDLALPCDSIRVEADGISYSIEADNAYVRVIYNSPTAQEALEYTSGKVHYYDIQTGNTYDCTISAESAIASNIEENQWAIDINLTETLGNCYPKAQLSLLDSINFEGYFAVLDVGLNPEDLLHHHDLSRFRTYHYWKNKEGEELNCDHVGDRMFVNNYQIELDETLTGLSSCREGRAVLEFEFLGSRFGDLFPSEIRPAILVDSLEVIIPEGFVYRNGSSTYQYAPDVPFLIADPVIEEMQDGRERWLFANDGSWVVGDKTSHSTLAGGLAFSYSSPCSNTRNLEYTYYYQSHYYSDDTDCIESESIFTEKHMIIGKKHLTISNINYENEGFARQNTAEIELCNLEALPIVAPYFILRTQTADLEVLNVTTSDIDIPFQQSNLVDGNILVLFEGLNWSNMSCITLVVTTAYSDCFNNNDLRFHAAYTCDEYPEEYSEVACLGTSETMRINPKPAEVQLQVSSPTEAVPLCEPFVYEFTINSAQLANIYEPILEVEFPPLGGLSLGGVPTIEYPLGTTPRNFAPQFTPTGLRIDLAAADWGNEPSANIFENGIEGLGVGTADTRKAIVRMPLITDCNFISGSSIRASITANRPCGSPAVGSGITQLLEPILIEGAIPSYITLTTIDSEAVSYCEANSIVKVQIINEGPATTSADEHCYIFIPQNVQYLEGSTESLTENTVGEPLQNIQNTLTQLDFTMPEGVAANDTIVFTFDVDASELAECQDAFVEFIAQTIEFVPLFCVIENAECNLPVKTSEGTGYFDITVGGPEMNLSATAQTGCSPEASGELMIDVTLLNSGNKAVLTENVVVDIYLDLNGNGTADAPDILLDSLIYTDLINVGEVVTLTGEWAIDPALLSPLIFVLSADNYCNGCEDVTFYIPQVNPISALTLEYEIECNEEAEIYTTFVDLIGGVPPYSISGSALAVTNNNNFNIPDIPYGFPLQFFVEDGAGCKDTVTINDLCGVTLPIKLLFFEGKTLEGKNLLQWQTASELNNDYFTLKRSANGQKYDLVTVIAGKGTTSILQNYSYVDSNPFIGTTYYQLSQTDFDGKIRKLKTISLHQNNSYSRLQITSVQPIPAKDFFNLECFSPISQSLELQVFDIYSKPIYHQQLTAAVGNNDWRLNCSSWSKGVYFLQLKGIRETVFVKILVQ